MYTVDIIPRGEDLPDLCKQFRYLSLAKKYFNNSLSTSITGDTVQLWDVEHMERPRIIAEFEKKS